MGNQGNLIELGRFIRLRRKELHLTQTELGNRLGWAQERVSVLENGKYGLPALPQLCRLAEALSVPVTTMLEHVGIDGLEIERRPADGAVVAESVHLSTLSRRVTAMYGQVEVVENRLHDAERQMHRAEQLCASLRTERARMATLLAECRDR